MAFPEAPLRAVFSLSFLAAMLGVGCGDQGPTPVAGTYILQTIDGKRSPFAAFTQYDHGTVDDRPVLVEALKEFVSDTLRLWGDGTFEQTAVVRVTARSFDVFTGELVDSTTTVSSSTGYRGSYTVAGRTVEFTYFGDVGEWVRTGTLEGDVLTVLAGSGANWVYRRRD